MRITKKHIIGYCLGIITPILSLPLVLLVLTFAFDYEFKFFWNQFVNYPEFTSKYLSLSCIPNLILFYYFLNREQYQITRGIILATMSIVPYAIYVNLIQ